jgi:hypothetical protein
MPLRDTANCWKLIESSTWLSSPSSAGTFHNEEGFDPFLV